MTPQEKAEQLVLTFGRIKYAVEAANLIKGALTKYGVDSGDLQNMASEFKYWEKVKSEIYKITLDP